MFQFIKHFYSTEKMLKPGQALGEIPSTAQAYRTNFHIAWPSAVEAVLVSLIASVDTIMVGSLGPAAIAAVGITTQPKLILLAVIFSLNVGVTALVARRRGADDRAGANGCLRQGVMLCTGLALVMTVLGFVFAQDIIAFAGAQPDTIVDATRYFQIILIGNFFSSVGLTINAAQRGVGNTKISMNTNLVANGVNLVFNYLLIGGNFGFPRWGVAGAAVATVLGNFIGFILSIHSVLRHDGFLNLLHGGSWRFEAKTIRGMAKVGSSAMVEQVFMRIGFFTYAKLVAELGTVALAAHQICMNILNISFSFGDGFGIAASSLVGQSLGAKRPDVATVYAKVGQRTGFTISVALFFIFIAGNTLFVELFSRDPQIIAMSRPLMLILAFACLLQISNVVLSGCLRGAGDTAYVAAISLVSIGILRPLVSWVLCYPVGWGLVGAWVGLLVDQAVRSIAIAARFSGNKWTKIQL